jgi:hypothetical protein
LSSTVIRAAAAATAAGLLTLTAAQSAHAYPGGNSPASPKASQKRTHAPVKPKSRSAALQPEITEDDRDALADLTDGGFMRINSFLRSPNTFTQRPQEKIQERVEAVSAALGKLRPVPGETYRGTDLSDDLLALYEPVKPGESTKYVTDPGFLATSTSKAKALDYATNAIITVKGQSGKNVTPYSIWPSETEITYDKRTPFIPVSKQWNSELRMWDITIQEA